MGNTVVSRGRFYGGLGLAMLFGAPALIRLLQFGASQSPSMASAGARVAFFEAQSAALLLGIAALGALLPGWPRAAARAAVLALAMLGATDALVGVTFNCRLHLADLAGFGSPENVAMFVRSISLGPPRPGPLAVGALLLAAGLPGAWALVAGRWPGGAAAALRLCGAAALCAAIGGFGEAWARARLPSRQAATLLAGPLAVHLRDGVGRRFSPTYAARLSPRTPPQAPGAGGAARRPDIVLLVLESWSPYHSRLFGGAKDWSPRLDGLAARHARFTRFFANGYMTEEGLVACLTGHWPLPPAGVARKSADLLFFAGSHGEDQCPPPLPAALRDAGYQTAFLTPGTLSFSRKNRWLPSIGFGLCEGNTAALYRGWPVTVMDGPGDAALYARAEQWMAQRDPGAPLFLTLESTSGHLPWTHPEGGPHDEEGVMRYADARAAEFLSGIESSGFLENGLVIVVSDHRALTPHRPDEAPLGHEARSRVPMFVMGGGLPPGLVVDAPFQQIDIPNSLRWLVSRGPFPASPWAGNFLRSPMLPPRAIAHHHNHDRGLLDVFVPGPAGLSHSLYSMDGDRSGFLCGPAGPELGMEIDALRLERGLRAIAEAGGPEGRRVASR